MKLNLFESKRDFILAHLNLNDQKNLQTLQYMNQQQQQQQSEYLLFLLPSEPTISFALLCPGLPEFESFYLIPYLRIFRRFLLLKKETFTFTLLLEPIIQYFDSFQPYLLSIILDGIITQDPTIVSYMKRIIKLYINNPKVNKETLISVEFITKNEENEDENERNEIIELLSQDIHNINDPIIIQDNQDNLYFSYYVKSILLPYSKLNSNCAQYFYEHYGTTVSKRVEMAYLFIDVPDFIFTSTDSFELYQNCDSDIEKDQIFYIWSKSKQNGYFNEMICEFLDSINVHISTYAKNVFDTLKIPSNDDQNEEEIIPVDTELILTKIEEAVLKFLRHPNVLMLIWTMVMNNIHAFPNLTQRFWSLLLIQVANIRFYAKKTQITSTTPITEALTKIFTYSPPPPNVSHQVIYHFSMFLTSTLKSIIENYNTIPTKKSIPFLKCCKKLNQMYGNQLHVATDFFQIFLECFTKNVQQKQLQLQQQQNQQLYQHVSQSSASNFQIIFDIIMQYVPKMITSVLKFDPPFKLEPIVDALLPVSLLTSSISWPYALNALHQIASVNLYTEKMKKLVDNIEKEETGVFIFPLLWINSAFSEYRLSTLLPSVIKWCNNNNNNSSSSTNSSTSSGSNQQSNQQQQSQRPSNVSQQQQQVVHSTSSTSTNSSSSSSTSQFQETSIHQFMLKAAFKTMIDYPVGQTIQKLFSEMNQENPKRYASFFLPSILITPTKSRFVTNCIESYLQDPKMCMIIASPNVAPAEEDIQFKFGILAKLSYIMTHPDSVFLDELANTGTSSESGESEFDLSSTFSFEMKALVSAAQTIDALEIPLGIIMYKFLPKFITRNQSIHKFLQITHLFRPEYKKMSLNSFFLPNSNSIIAQLKQRMDDQDLENSSTLSELGNYEKSIMKWNSTSFLSSLDEVFLL